MKKNLFVVFIVLALLVSMLPVGNVFAKASQDITITVRNQTRGVASLLLIDNNGNRRYYTFQPGDIAVELVPVGRYAYFLSTPCGNETGAYNLNRHKQLDLYCAKEGREAPLFVPFTPAPVVHNT